MHTWLVLLILATFTLFGIEDAEAAQSQFVKGTATVPLKGKCRKDVPRDNKIFQAAFTQAKIEALRAYTSRFSRAKQNTYKMVADEVEMNIDQYLANPSVVGQRCDSQTKTFTIVLRGQLNTSDLNYLISQNMASSGPAAPVVALFLARETKSVKQLKVRDNVVSKTTSTSSDDKMADVTENSVSSERVSSSMQATSTGGSLVIGSDDIDWIVSRPSYIETAFNKTMTDSGFEPYEAQSVAFQSNGEFDLDAFEEEFGTANSISTETRGFAEQFLKRAGVKYFIVGTIDVGAKNNDPVSGQVKVVVSVSAKVSDVSGLFSKSVASVGPVTLSALGIDQDTAKKNALVVAAERAADEIVASLQAKGIN